jgi:TRAP-type uncharacterized transport system fused permease subunit
VKIGVQAFAYDLRTAILPFLFFFNPKLLLIGIEGPLDLAWTVASAAIGMYAFVAATQGTMRARLNLAQRGLALAAAMLLIRADTLSSLLGLALCVGLYAFNRRRAASLPAAC